MLVPKVVENPFPQLGSALLLPATMSVAPRSGGEAEAPGKGLLFKNFIFLPFLSTATAVSVPSPPQ